MKINARFQSTCPVCFGAINPGDQVEWSKGQKAKHVACPKTSVQRSAKTTTKPKPKPEPQDQSPAPFSLGGGSGYGCNGWTVGQTVRTSERLRTKGYPEFLTVVRASRTYVHEDGLCFGVGEDSGYSYSADCREATEEEAAPVIARIAKAETKKNAKSRVQDIAKMIKKIGDKPEGVNQPEGNRVLDSQNIYGGGEWFVSGPDWIWYVRNNGADGDCWAENNVRTGGAGAIGWRIPYTEELETELKNLEATIKG